MKVFRDDRIALQASIKSNRKPFFFDDAVILTRPGITGRRATKFSFGVDKAGVMELAFSERRFHSRVPANADGRLLDILRQRLPMSASFSRRWTSQSSAQSPDKRTADGKTTASHAGENDSPDDEFFNQESPNFLAGDVVGETSASYATAFSCGTSSPKKPPHPVRMVTPLHYQPEYKYPLLVWLHSSGHNENQIEYVLPHISSRNYVAIGVRGTRATDLQGRGFDWPGTTAAIEKAAEIVITSIDLAAAEYSIHPDRVILAGYGSGATLACEIALRDSKRFAGVVSMAGRMPVASGGLKDFKRLRERRLPMLWQHAINGVDDEPDRLQQEIVMAQLIRAQVEIRQYRDDDVMNTVALKDIDRWCFDKIISPKPVATCDGPSSVDGSEYRVVGFSAN